jgi:hypothetical protein
MESPRGGVHGEGDHSPSPEAARMLHEMALREGGEVDLTDEQLRSNDQLQQDEVPHHHRSLATDFSPWASFAERHCESLSIVTSAAVLVSKVPTFSF